MMWSSAERTTSQPSARQLTGESPPLIIGRSISASVRLSSRNRSLGLGSMISIRTLRNLSAWYEKRPPVHRDPSIKGEIRSGRRHGSLQIFRFSVKVADFGFELQDRS